MCVCVCVCVSRMRISRMHIKNDYIKDMCFELSGHVRFRDGNEGFKNDLMKSEHIEFNKNSKVQNVIQYVHP